MTGADRHDAVLAALPVLLVAAPTAAWLGPLSFVTALGGALAAVVPLAYALFVRPPTDV